MTQNDDIKDSKKQVLDLLLEGKSKELGLNDIIQIQDKFNDNLVLSVILYKLIEERKQTNKILSDLQEKYDQLMFAFKNSNNSNLSQSVSNNHTDNYQILSEIDDQIISFLREHKKTDAETIKTKFNYKKTNAASQRLNALVRQGYLKKVQAGRKVYFLIK